MKPLLAFLVCLYPLIVEAADPNQCAAEAKFVEVVAQHRDQGMTFSDSIDKVRTSDISKAAKERLMKQISIVYEYKEFSPDKIARLTFDVCLKRN